MKLAVEDHLLTISVADQGLGIGEENLSSILDPFVRVNFPQSGNGYGLVLAITRKVLLAHGGFRSTLITGAMAGYKFICGYPTGSNRFGLAADRKKITGAH